MKLANGSHGSQYRNWKSIVGSIALSLFIASTGFGQVAFDVNQIAPARDASNLPLLHRFPNSRFVDVRLDVSALFNVVEAAMVTEYTIRIVSRHEDVLVADYSPRTEMQTDVFGGMQVSSDNNRSHEAAIQGAAGYPGVGSAYGYAFSNDQSHEIVHYVKKPALELLTASGTIERQRGAYFKLRQSSQMTLEGAREFHVVFEVPDAWRADLLDVTIQAVGFESQNSRKQSVIATQPFVVSIYHEYDEYAANAATKYIKHQDSLTQTARSYSRAIQHRNFPTPFHKLGAKLDIYEPEIPRNWFESLVYQPGITNHISKLSSLPVDVRVAILNFVDQKTLVESLSGSKTSPQVASSVQITQTIR